MASQSVGVGDVAPDFTLPSGDGGSVSLSDFRGKSEVVLFFYPKDNSPACTAEVCSFRDSYEAFREAGAEVIGVSADSVDSHRQFASALNVSFPILSDAKQELRKLYGVPKTLGLIPGRVTYLIDKQGVVRRIFASQLQIRQHVGDMLLALKEMREAERGNPPGSHSA